MTRSTIMLIVSASLLVVSIGFLLFGVNIVLSKGETYITQKQDIKNAEGIVEQLEEYRRVLEATEEARASLQGRVLNRENTVEFLSRIEGVAANKNIELPTVSLNEVESENGTSILQATYVMKGHELDVMSMLRLFETLPYHTTIDQVEYSRDTKEIEGTPSNHAELKIRALLTLE